jgi:ribosomal protein S18 acetylase RimI-like enzyme
MTPGEAVEVGGLDRPPITIRQASASDAAGIADVYLSSFHATYDFPLAHTDDQVRGWLAGIAAGPDAWVALDGEQIVGMMVVTSGELDQLYVAPDRLGTGIGRQLLELAMDRSPAGLRLYTFQVNARARRFYERNGFVVLSLGDGSGNEEGQPDVEYAWRPAEPLPA